MSHNKTKKGKSLMKRYTILLLILMSAYSVAFAQTIFTGKITDGKGTPLSDITVMALSEKDTTSVIAYTFTESDGRYKLQFDSNESEIRLMVYGFNIKKISETVKNISATHNYKTEKESIELQEVVVKSGKIWQLGDTLNYSVDAFIGKNDISIGDVLRRMPGIQVDDNGHIYYQGKNISHLYINGMDALAGRYSIATNNLAAQMVATVQVMENHQGVKALKKLVIPDEAAINLKLKPEAAGTLNMEALLGVGADDNGMMWHEEAVMTYFSKKRQHIATYKTANDGTDVSAELASCNNSGEAEQFTDIVRPTPPGIDKHNYYFNQSHAASINSVWKNDDDHETRLNIVYSNDHEHRNSYDKTTYLLPDGSNTVISEQLADAATENRAEGDFEYKINKEKLYLSETAGMTAHWNSGKGYTDNSEAPISQSLWTRNISMQNRLSMIIKKDDYKGVAVNSLVTYEEKPQALTVMPCMYDSIFGNGNYTGMRQDVKSRRFMTENSAEMLSAIKIGNFRISPKATLNYNHSGMESVLNTTGAASTRVTDFANDTYLSHLKTGITAMLDYYDDSLNAGINVPLMYEMLSLNQKIQQNSIIRNDFNVSLTAYVRWKALSNLTISSHYTADHRYPSLSTLYGGYILTNYRQIASYEAYMPRMTWQAADIDIDFKDPFNMIFITLNASYSCRSPKVIYGETFNGILSHMYARTTSSRSEEFAVMLSAGKNISWKNISIKLTAQYSKGHMPVLRQEQITRYNSEAAVFTAGIKAEPFNFMSVDAGSSMFLSKGSTTDGYSMPAIRTMNNSLLLSLSMPMNISIDTGLNHYYNNLAIGNKSFALLNLKINLNHKRVKYSLECNNLLNTHKYVYSYNIAMSEFYSEYNLRGRSVMLTARMNLF